MYITFYRLAYILRSTESPYRVASKKMELLDLSFDCKGGGGMLDEDPRWGDQLKSCCYNSSYGLVCSEGMEGRWRDIDGAK